MGHLGDLIFFIKGLAVGLAIAAPVGPVAILCVKRTLLQGRVSGLMSGLGAATADLVYGLIAAFGLAVVADTLICCKSWMEIAGALLLFFLGIRTFRSTAKNLKGNLKKTSHLEAFSSTFLLTLTNPLTLFAFLGIFSALEIGGANENWVTALFLLLGVFIGSSCWWLILSEGITSFKDFLPEKLFQKVNHVAGTLLILFGILLLGNGLYELLK